jgi:hypothetical protein
MIHRRSLLMAGLYFAAQVISGRTVAASGSPRAEADVNGCRYIANEIETEARGRMFDPSTERLSWAPRLSGA